MPRSEHTGGTLSLHLLLDNWRSLFNVGSIFRTADGAGICEVHLCGITPTPAHRKLAKTALGAEIAVPWSYAPNAVARASELQAAGVAMWVLEGGEESRPLWECNPPQDRPVVLAAGNEVIGIDPGLLALADQVVHVPMLGHKGSLNVAIALSVAVYWLVGQAGSCQRSHCATPGKTI
jgi:tRNA G18 (ribose-2'-O)-methylase SpoU